ncbi:MAG: hypothetical protein VXZ77_04110 [Pseudomonadota bacterium]|nr:hypothetical protein [Pseudomonadota bacterium]
MNRQICAVIDDLNIVGGDLLNFGGFKQETKNSFWGSLQSCDITSVNTRLGGDYLVTDHGWRRMYDVIFMVEVLEYLDRPRDLIDDLAELQAAGGLFFVSFPWLAPSHTSDGEAVRFSRETVAKIFCNAGYSLTHCYRQGGVGSVVLDLWLALLPERIRNTIRLFIGLFLDGAGSSGSLPTTKQSLKDNINSTGFFLVFKKDE